MELSEGSCVPLLQRDGYHVDREPGAPRPPLALDTLLWRIPGAIMLPQSVRTPSSMPFFIITVDRAPARVIHHPPGSMLEAV